MQDAAHMKENAKNNGDWQHQAFESLHFYYPLLTCFKQHTHGLLIEKGCCA